MPGRIRSCVPADTAGLCPPTMKKLPVRASQLTPPGQPSPSVQPSRCRIHPQLVIAVERFGTQISMWCTAAAIGALSVHGETVPHRHRTEPDEDQPDQGRDEPRPPLLAGRRLRHSLPKKTACRGENQDHESPGDGGFLGHAFIVRARRRARSDTGASRIVTVCRWEGLVSWIGSSFTLAAPKIGGMVIGTRVEPTTYGAAAL